MISKERIEEIVREINELSSDDKVFYLVMELMNEREELIGAIGQYHGYCESDGGYKYEGADSFWYQNEEELDLEFD